VIEPSSVYIDVPPKELNISFVPDYDPVIGRGSFAEVYECYCDGFFQKNIGTVLKSIYPVEISLSKQILRELEVWNRLNHENIVKFYGIIRPDRLTLNKSDTLQLKFLIEKCQFVLHDYIIQISSDYPGFPDILHIALDISRGMTYLHSQKIIHLDLHSKNILLSTHLKYTAKISDFGLSRRIDDLEHVQLCRLSSNTVICRHIMAPEADQDEAVVGYATDVYSFGIILWEMLTLHNVIQWACINQRDSLGIVIVEIVQGNRDEQEMWLNLWEQRFSNLPIVCILQSSLFSKRDQIALFDMLELCLSCLNPDAGSRPAFSEIFDRISALVDQNSK
jgi:serine/threonine protein kinase